MGYGQLPLRDRIEGVEINRVFCGRARRAMASPWEGLQWARRCAPVARKLHEKDRFSAIHAHFVMPGGIVATRMGDRFGIPVLMTIHGSDVPGYNHDRLRLIHSVVRPWWRRICRNSDLITSPSRSLLELLQTRTPYCRRGLVIPNGIDVGRFQKGRKEKRILLCSRLVRRKGFHLLLEAVQSLELPGWHIDIVGEGPMFADLAAMAKDSRVPATLHGWIDNDDPRLADLYERATIFALPSQQENCSIALLGAMSAGCAIITTNISGNRQLVGDCGVLVQPGELNSLRNTVADLAANPGECERLGTLAATRARQHYDWCVIGQRYLDLLGDLTSNKKAA